MNTMNEDLERIRQACRPAAWLMLMFLGVLAGAMAALAAFGWIKQAPTGGAVTRILLALGGGALLPVLAWPWLRHHVAHFLWRHSRSRNLGTVRSLSLNVTGAFGFMVGGAVMTAAQVWRSGLPGGSGAAAPAAKFAIGLGLMLVGGSLFLFRRRIAWLRSRKQRQRRGRLPSPAAKRAARAFSWWRA